MKRWLGFICMLALFGTISVGDPLFGLMPELRPHAKKCRKLILEKYKEFRNRAHHAWRCQSKESKYSGKKSKRVWGFEKKRVKKTGLRRFVKPSYSLNRRSMEHPCKTVNVVVERITPEEPLVEKVVEVAPALPEKKLEAKKPKPRKIEKRIDEDEREVTSYVQAMRKQRREPQVDYSPAQPTSYPQTPPMPSYSPPMPFAAQAPIQPQMHYAQPMMQPQPLYQNNGGQIAACAMQMQASAMAMQAQASAMMMQAQQPAMPMMQQSIPQQQPLYLGQEFRGLPKKEKVHQLMQILQQLSSVSDQGIHRLLFLLDIECDIIEHLLARATGQVIERLVFDRNASLRRSNPLLKKAYDLTLDLAVDSGDSEADSRLYHYFIRRNTRSKESHTVVGKKKFLMQMMYQLEQYYQMIENMQNIVSI